MENEINNAFTEINKHVRLISTNYVPIKMSINDQPYRSINDRYPSYPSFEVREVPAYDMRFDTEDIKSIAQSLEITGSVRGAHPAVKQAYNEFLILRAMYADYPRF